MLFVDMYILYIYARNCIVRVVYMYICICKGNDGYTLPGVCGGVKRSHFYALHNKVIKS